MSDPDNTAVPSTTTVPVAFGGAPPGENVSVWMWPSAPPPASPVMVRDWPATTSDVYAARSAAACRVYDMSTVLWSVILGENASRTLPS